MIRSAARTDLPRIRDLLAGANDMPYDLARVVEEKCFGAGVAGEPEVRVYGDFAGVSVTCGTWLRILAVDRARRRQGIGTALLRDAEARGARGIGAEAGNYFTPGVLEKQAEFFIKRGYRETTRTQNLETTELPGPSAIKWRTDNPVCPPNPVPQPDGQDCLASTHLRRAAEGSGDRDRVLDFIDKQFGNIWRFEASHGVLFFTESDGTITGFAAHEANNRGLGFFGPTGVAASHRGKGIGTRLLLACLADARRLGHGRVVIPWTDAIDFYAKACGARVAHRFVVLRKG